MCIIKDSVKGDSLGPYGTACQNIKHMYRQKAGFNWVPDKISSLAVVCFGFTVTR